MIQKRLDALMSSQNQSLCPRTPEFLTGINIPKLIAIQNAHSKMRPEKEPVKHNLCHLAPRDTRSEVLQLLAVAGGGGGTPPPIGCTLHTSLDLEVYSGGDGGGTPLATKV